MFMCECMRVNMEEVEFEWLSASLDKSIRNGRDLHGDILSGNQNLVGVDFSKTLCGLVIGIVLEQNCWMV